ncbi:MAG: hypothetical protein DPW18_08025 [Chloroflexi bacterium]|nr:hypothetical protein [Chloroflexota bacterium]MDL1942812.1 hypothetical protein [Chloroflexi bacterium CFX2]
MNRKLDLPALLLFAALLFGVIVRFYPAAANGFPLNDGGMFYTMTQDLKANGYALPEFTTYNQADIPFAYPPFGFYAAALLSAPAPGSGLWVFLYLPAFVNSLAMLAFYLFAREILNSRLTAVLAALFYVLLPHSFVWQVMGGGITRAFGMLFLLLTLWQAAQLFRNYKPKHLALAILFGAGAVTSHPQTALHAALGGFLLFLFYGRGKRSLLFAVLVGLGVALLSAPWWGTALSRHGLEPFLSAGGTSPRTLESYLSILSVNSLEDYLVLPVLALAFIGFFFVRQAPFNRYFPPAWAALAVLLDPRGGDGFALLALLLLAGGGLVILSAWISREKDEQPERLMMKRGNSALLFGLTIFLLLGGIVFDFQLVNTSLKTKDLELIEWVEANTADGAFLLATGREFSMSDPLQEWFPALTRRRSLTTMQGLEWTLAGNFFPWYEQVTAFQRCADILCVTEWAARNGVEYDYLIVLIPDEDDTGGLSESLRSLGISARGSDSHVLIFESDHALIFQVR